MIRSRGLLALLAVLSCDVSPACGQAGSAGTVLEIRGHRLVEDFAASTELSAEGRWALRTVGDRQTLIDLVSRKPAEGRLHAGVDTFESARFCGKGLLKLGTRLGQRAWFRQATDAVAAAPATELPADATPLCSADGRLVAYYKPAPQSDSAAPSAYEISLGNWQRQAAVRLDFPVTGAVFSHDGRALYALTRRADGTSLLYGISTRTRNITVIADRLDASGNVGHPFAVTAQDDAIVIPLAGTGRRSDSQRQMPRADRWLKLYRLSLSNPSPQLIRAEEGADQEDPTVIGNNLYWVSTRVTKSVAVVDATGVGPVRELNTGPDAYLPAWSADGRRMAFVVGQHRLVDFPLNYDVALADIDANARLTSEPRMFMIGDHQDSAPSWSTDGRWIVWHSSWPPHDVAYSTARGATDAIWLRSAEDPAAPAIRVTTDLAEGSLVYWAPDGRGVIYTGRDRQAPPGIYQVRTSSIDSTTGQASKARRVNLPASIHSALVAEWSPKGDVFAVEDRVSATEHALWVVSADGSHADRILAFPSDTRGGIAWMPDGQELVFAALEGEHMQIFTVPLATGLLRRITDGSGNFLLPRVSPDGRWIAFSRIQTVQTLHRVKSH
jgi:Tol biopolymer transport system component